MQLCILVGYIVFYKKFYFRGQSVHFWLCDITKHGIYKIGHISATFKDRLLVWTKKFYIIMRKTFHYFGGYQVHHVTRHELFFLKKSATIIETVHVRHIPVVTIIHRLTFELG